MENPFVLIPYLSKSTFCDRKEELRIICDYIQNASNISLISPRRYGKTGLIYRVFDEINDLKLPLRTFYIDIYATQSLEDFIEKLTEGLADVLNKGSVLKKLLKSIGNIRPVLTYDTITHKAKLSFTFANEQEKKASIQSIFNFLEAQETRVLLAIDEFQQIREYEGVNMEALLRSYIQPLKNVQFIFCGSKKHIMAEMFTDARSPFYESTRHIYLDKIDRETYANFIEEKFTESGKTITREAIDYILDWTRIHTFYTQTLCNTVFMQCRKNATMLDVYRAIDLILTTNTETFMQWRSILTRAQWNFLHAVAKEGVVEQPTASEFISKYKIGTPSNSKRLLEALVEKELILPIVGLQSTTYTIYNVFLSRWLERI